MQRTGKLALIVAAWVVGVAASSPALAFHRGSLFDEPAGAGGAGGITYGGIPGERGWTCAACHVDAAGTVSVALTSDPPDLMSGRYEPGRSYVLTATLVGEHCGLQMPEANLNSVSITAVDSSGAQAGAFFGYAPEALVRHDAASVVSAGVQTAATSWLLSWQAPTEASGPVTIHVAAVDGDGDAGPFGDDVYVGTIPLASATATGAIAPPAAPGRAPPQGSSAWLAMLGLGGLWGARRKLRPCGTAP